MTSEPYRQRAIGALVGSVVGDALGAPFEFGPAHAFSRRFPTPGLGTATEMCGGGAFGWEPAEWTDDTQMGLCVAASLLDHGDLDLEDVWSRFRAWADAHPPDIGVTTSAALYSGLPWQEAAASHYRRSGRATGNGGLMRSSGSRCRPNGGSSARAARSDNRCMGWSYRKSIKVGPLRLNLSRRGVGVSTGAGPFRYSISPTGRRTRSLRIPGTGWSWRSSSRG
jgi:ADP-ribosylglycohydrolase